MVSVLVTIFILAPFAVVAVALRNEKEAHAKRLLQQAGIAGIVDVDMQREQITFKDAQPPVLLTFSREGHFAVLTIERVLRGRGLLVQLGDVFWGSDAARALFEGEAVRARLAATRALRDLRVTDEGNLVMRVNQHIVEKSNEMRAPNRVIEVTLGDLHHNAGELRALAALLAELPIEQALDGATSSPSGAPVPAPFGGDRD